MHYKLWLQIEEIDDETDHYENIYPPVSVRTFETKHLALVNLRDAAILLGAPPHHYSDLPEA